MQALDEWGLPYEVNEGDGAFYGPKIDIKVKDAIGRVWQLSTIQVDFNLPERFDLVYRTPENTEKRPFMLHRAIFGSMERFFGILIEHTAGNFPTWLAPTQAVIIPIADRHMDYAENVMAELARTGVRAEIYAESEPMKVKIAKAQSQKVPYMLVVGDKESDADSVAVRDRTEGDIGAMTTDEFAQKVASEIP
jgi:threonyl-tRNA synthetase